MIFDATIKELLNKKLSQLEKKLQGDVIFYFGEIQPGLLRLFRDLIEDLKRDKKKKERLVIILNTTGGSAEIAEKMVVIFPRKSGHNEELVLA